MKTLQDFIFEAKLKLPYKFDIYNEGPKNKDYKITKKNIYSIYFKLEKNDDFDSSIKLPLPADKISYAKWPSKESTDNWTKLPEIRDYMYAGAWYSDKYCEYNYDKYNRDWSTWFKMLKPFMKGKISVTMEDSGDKGTFGKYLALNVDNAEFNKAREEKIKELSNVDNLKKWAEEADAKEKAEIEKRAKEEAERKKAQDDWNTWWNSLSDDERLSWSMGYGRGSGNWTGD